MPIGIEDIVAAKIIAQLGWVHADELREDLAALDGDPAQSGLLGRLGLRGALLAAQQAKVRRYVELYERVRREALYCALLERSQILSKDEVAGWKERLEAEGYAMSLGEHLVASKRITPVQAGTLRQQQFVAIDNENDKLLLGYRKNGFEGVSRPLTKNPKARIATGIFTIKNLFRSAESQRLARAALMVPASEPEARRGYPERVGAYSIERVLGRGGMGIVLQARHEKGGEPVALKLALAKDGSGADEVKARMRREILATSMVHHENIVHVLDAGHAADGSPFLVMELVRGRELRELMRERAFLSPRDALAVFVQVLAAAGAAHRAGIVHRDLKPENVLVVEERQKEGGSRLLAKLMDFGLARILEIDPAHEDKVFKTQATDVVSGSPQYSSPEQILGDPITARTDLYALGVVLFELLTGSLPWTATSMNDVVRAHLARPPRTLASVATGVVFPPALEALVASLLEKKPEKRPVIAEAVLETIDRLVLPALEVERAPARPGRGKAARGITRMLDSLQRPEEPKNEAP